ncbi:OmpA family protein [Hyphococcus formosus]|uniref:OmpA family protein n=1 Tax=Hyphococcus formosus TaxID=3143534 RepID=UPI00398ABC8F
MIKSALGILAVGLIGTAALVSDYIPGSAQSVEQVLLEDAQRAVPPELPIDLAIDGQKLILKGELNDTDTRTRTLALAADAVWSGGIIMGGITAIDASGLKVTTLPPKADPFIWFAENEGDALVFSGFVPSAAARETLYSLAEDIFTGHEISGTLEIASGVPGTDADWVKAASALLRGLSYLRDGVAQANGPEFSLNGVTRTSENEALARAAMTSLPDFYRSNILINISPAPVSIDDLLTETVLDDAVVKSPVETADQEIEISSAPNNVTVRCREDIAAIIARRKIGFSSALADLDLPSRNQLREISTKLNECENIRLRITGHTDSSGNANRNRQLSGYRADAVRAFMISVGAPAERLSTRGAGSSEPLVSNATPAGREQNRRIEFDIITDDN